MSFNPNDNNLSPISRINYEEYFLLYADNELTDTERLSVEQFLIAHPDLQPELDLLLATKLPLEHISMEDKESLLSHSMRLDAIDETLLLYIDNELSGPEKISIEEKLRTDKAYAIQYYALLKTKPVTLDTIIYPYKEQLYHHEEKKRFSFYWMRIAAAVIITLGMGIVVFTYQPRDVITGSQDPEKIRPGKETPGVEQYKKEVPVKETEPTVVKIGESDDAVNVIRTLEKKPVRKENKTNNVVTKPSVTPQTIVNNEEHTPEQNNIAVNKTLEAPPQQTINNNNVTSPSTPSLNDQTTSIVAAAQKDVVKADNQKNASLKGFLRKATRFIERRTNISTTNENNELLIGVVAIQL